MSARDAARLFWLVVFVGTLLGAGIAYDWDANGICAALGIMAFISFMSLGNA